MITRARTLALGLLATTGPSLAQDLLGVHWLGYLYKLDSSSGTTTLFGETGVGDNNCMALDPATDLAYVVAEKGSVLVTLNAHTGAVLSTRAIAVPEVRGMAFRPEDGLLYMSCIGDVFDNELRSLDPVTGVDSPVANMGFGGVQSMAYNPRDGLLYGHQFGGIGLFTMDPDTGVVNDPFPAVGMQNTIQALTFSSDGRLLGANDDLFEISLVNGSEIWLASLGASVRGLDFLETGIGSHYCNPAVYNSTGRFAVMTAAGSTEVAANDVTLFGTNVPPNEFGLFLNSRVTDSVYPPGSKGRLCLGPGIGRYLVQSTGGAGLLERTLDLTQTPTSSGIVAIQPGETWFFQAWFRDVDPDPTSNFTNGLYIAFQ